MSHTVKTKVEFKNKAVLALAIAAMGGKVIGEGSHRLFSSNVETGFGFNLPGWRYPLILTSNGELRYDDYHGNWGNVADLARLKATYAIEIAREVAANQGWYCETVGENLVITHPEGGTFTVTPEGVVDANGFQGSACEIGSIIENALGQTVETVNKAEFYAEKIALKRG